MRYIAYDTYADNLGTNVPVCGPDTQAPWARFVIHDLVKAHKEFANNLKTTGDCLAEGKPFAYILSWRYYFGYDDNPNTGNGPKQLRESMKWLFQNKPLLDAFRSGQGWLVFTDWHEGVYMPPFLTYHHNDKFACFFNTFDIPPKHVFFVDGNARGPDFDRPQSPRFIYENIFERASLGMYVQPGVLPEPRSLVHPVVKPLRYLSYARHWNTMRQFFTFDLFNRDLLKYGIVSCSAENQDGTSKPEHFIPQLDHWSRSIPAVRAHQFLATLPMVLDADLNVNQAVTLNLKHHLDTDISLIHETHSNPESVFLSEKTYRAILAKHPFLMMGSPGLLAKLRTDGYQTYGCLFDESYDEEPNLIKRKELVLIELARFIHMDTEERHRKLEAAQEVAAFNQDFYLRHGRQRFGKNLLAALKE